MTTRGAYAGPNGGRLLNAGETRRLAGLGRPECHRRSGCVAGLQVAPTPSRRDNLWARVRPTPRTASALRAYAILCANDFTVFRVRFAYSPPPLRDRWPLRACGVRPAPTPTRDYRPRASRFLGRQRSSSCGYASIGAFPTLVGIVRRSCGARLSFRSGWSRGERGDGLLVKERSH